MRKAARVGALVTVVLGMLAVPVGAEHAPCDGAVIGLFVVNNEAALYVDDRGGDGRWIYLESNGAFGLQPGGSIVGVIRDPCGDPATADTLVAYLPPA